MLRPLAIVGGTPVFSGSAEVMVDDTSLKFDRVRDDPRVFQLHGIERRFLEDFRSEGAGDRDNGLHCVGEQWWKASAGVRDPASSNLLRCSWKG